MEAARRGPLIAATIYVFAVALVLSGRPEGVSPEIEASIELRQIARLATLITADDSEVALSFRESIVLNIEDLARRRFATDKDRFLGAAVALSLGNRGLVPLYLGPIASRDRAANLLTTWAFDPSFSFTSEDIAQIKNLDLGAIEAQLLEALVSSEASDKSLAPSVSLTTLIVIFALFASCVLAVGTWLWIRSRNWPSERRLVWPGWGVLEPPVRVFIYSLCVSLTTTVFVPYMETGFDPVVTMVVIYAIYGVISLLIVRYLGAPRPGESWMEQLGLKGAFLPSRLPRAFVWALGGWCMAWVAFLLASLASSFFITPRNTSDPFVALIITNSSGRGLLLFSLAIMAPLLEESIFRGYMYSRLRVHMPPKAAALLSGLAFGVAHLSITDLIPLIALGYTFARIYERTKDITVPILAHSAWNLANAILAISIFS